MPGNLLQIDADRLAANAAAKEQAANAKPAPMVRPDGALVVVQNPDVALTQGYKPASPAQIAHMDAIEGAGGGAKAGLEGVARGATFGLSDIAESKLGLAQPEDILARKEAHPYLSTLGTAVGGAGLAAATGGLGLAGEGAGIAARLGAGALTGGLEGGGNEFARQVLENKGLSAEQVAQQALLGTALGTLGASGGEALGLAARGLGKGATALRTGLEDLAAPAEVAAEAPNYVAQNAAKKQLLKLSSDPAKMTEINRAIQEEIEVAGSAVKAQASNSASRSDLGKAIAEMIETSDAGIDSESAADLATGLRGFAKKGEFESTVPVWKKGLRVVADRIDSKVADDASEGVTARTLQQARQRVDELLDKIPSTRPKPPELVRARQMLSEELHEAMGEDFGQLNREYGARAEADKILRTMATKEMRKAGASVPPSDFKAEFGKLFAQVKDVGNIAVAATGHPVAALAKAGLQYGAGKAADYLAMHPDFVGNMAGQLAGSSALVRAASLSDAQWGRAIGSLLSGASAGAVGDGGGIPAVSDYNHLAETLRTAAENPTHVAANLTNHVGGVVNNQHPEIADQANQTTQRAIGYLNSKLPVKTVPASLLDTAQEPDVSQKQEWLQAYAAVMHPASVFVHPTKPGMEALKAVYPAMHDMAQQKLLTHLRGKQLTYQEQLRLSKVMGMNVSSMTNPEFVSGMQQILAGPDQKPDGQQGSARTVAATRAKAMNFKNTVEDSQTQLSRIMARQ